MPCSSGLLALGRLFWKGDEATIDELSPDNLAARALDMAGVLMPSGGYLYHYAFVMLVGVAGLVTYFMMTAAR
jgi:NADH-quinone oxidoreductase subunit L